MRTTTGAVSPMMRAYSDHRPERAPPMPAPRPAVLRSWQGKPPTRTSAAGRAGDVADVAEVLGLGEAPCEHGVGEVL